MKLITSLLLAAFAIIIAAPGLALAAEIRNGPTAVVAPGETVDDDLFAASTNVTIGGHVTGDVYALGQTIVVTGAVDGDLLGAGQQVIVDGTVGGDVRVAGATVTVNGSVGRNISALAQQVIVSSTGRIGGSVVGLGETISAFGAVGRTFTAAGSTVQLAGPIGGKVLAWTDTFSVAPTARIAGDVEYRARQEANLPSGTVSGGVRFTQAAERQPRPEPLLNGLFDLGGLVWLVGCGILGALALMLAPRGAARAVELGRQQPLQSFGLGLLALIAAPIAAVVIAVTLVGIPLSLTLAAIYALALLLAWPAVGMLVGTELGRRVRPEQPLPVLGALALGLIVLHLVTHLPLVGWLAACLGLVLGLGMVVQSLRRWRRPMQLGAQPVPQRSAA
jgi:cytoskeletal protein CcmA (bactofilin family)